MFRIKQYMKMLLQNVFLPLVYAWYARRPVQPGLVIFADAHHDEIPFSMRRMYEDVMRRAGKDAQDWRSTTQVTEGAQGRRSMKQTGEDAQIGRSMVRKSDNVQTGRKLDVQVFVRDFGKMPYSQMVKYLIRFMKQYAAAEYVFICDYYLPVASCRKRPETTVVQLWHSCGLMKKIAYDAGDDIPANYRGNMFGNYTYLTLSAEVCVPVHARALRFPQERIRATGVSRTDCYFDEDWNNRCREAFYEQYPDARGKKIALWAPTFRGNAAHPVLCGLEAVQETSKALGPEWYFIIKVHPHIDAHGQVSNCQIPTEELLCVADVLITDYSSVMFDYLIYEKPLVMFAPDLKEYEDGRGFYIDYAAMPFPITENAEQLIREVKNIQEKTKEQAVALKEWKELYTGACDGHSSQRILDLVGLGK